jgi:hypothetical protein
LTSERSSAAGRGFLTELEGPAWMDDLRSRLTRWRTQTLAAVVFGIEIAGRLNEKIRCDLRQRTFEGVKTMTACADDLDRQDRMVALFTALRIQSLYSAMNGLWIDLLRAPLNLAARPDGAASLSRDAAASFERLAKRDLKAAGRIVELLLDEVRAAEHGVEREAPDGDETADEFTQRCLEQSDDGDAYEAEEILDDFAQSAVKEIHDRVECGLDSSALPRLTAVIREVIGNDAILEQYIDPATGEYHSDPDDDASAEEMVDEGDPNTD